MVLYAPINEIMPAEVMGENFLCCILEEPLKYQQPDTRIAPMVLCHACSHWREIALQTPYIWTHLYHVAFIKSSFGTFYRRDIAFLRWWGERVGCLPAYLRLAFKKDDGTSDPHDGSPEIHSPDSFFAYMVKFMSNSRYLNLDFHYNNLLRTICGERSLLCPNLETLAMVQGFNHEAPFVFFNPTTHAIEPGEYDTERFIPVVVRRLFMEDIFLSLDDLSSILDFSNITHLTLSEVDITLKGWFSLLRECVSLMYGSFKVTLKSDLQNPITVRPKILPHLQKITFQNFGDHLEQSFLDALLLPSLTELRLDKHYPVTVDYLHRLLISTPALRMLQLGETLPPKTALLNSVFVPGDLNPPAPLSSLVPHLESIYFAGTWLMIDLFNPQNKHLARRVLLGDWLELGRPSSRISSVQFGMSWESGKIPFWKINRLVEELQGSMPEGVKLSLRGIDEPPIWPLRQPGTFVDEFEDVRLGRASI